MHALSLFATDLQRHVAAATCASCAPGRADLDSRALLGEMHDALLDVSRLASPGSCRKSGLPAEADVERLDGASGRAVDRELRLRSTRQAVGRIRPDCSSA
jgi:hypothetical protein